MTSETESAANAAEAKALAEAPEYTEKLAPLLTVLAVATVIVSPWPAILNLKYGLWISYALPWLFFVGYAVNNDRVTKKRAAKFSPVLKAKYGLDDQALERVWKKSAPIGDLAGWLIFISMVYLMVCYAYDYLNSKDFLGYVGHGMLFGALRFFIMLLTVAAGLVLGVLPMLPVLDDTGDSQTAPVTPTSILSLEGRDRNDIEIIGIEVELAMISKRVEAYTLESTLLSALAFSAFITIKYSEKSLESLGPLKLPAACHAMSGPGLVGCLNDSILAPMKSHTMLFTCFWLLACSVSFLAVLVARLRFNESFRYNDEIVRIAQKLNERENALPSGERDFIKALTDEIDILMARARVGMRYLNPMISFIKLFRDIGVICFIMAIATCGLYFGEVPMVAIILVFLFAYAFGYGDRLRHESGFLPQLKTTVVNVIRRGR